MGLYSFKSKEIITIFRHQKTKSKHWQNDCKNAQKRTFYNKCLKCDCVWFLKYQNKNYLYVDILTQREIKFQSFFL